ncbi:glycosyltransferase [Candidatus Woesearchaeota archaeon]|nr:glycosyltransferase [Candidatus Woesearchaeota archaeon]
MSKILMFSYEKLFSDRGIMSGPSSRLWEFALALRKKGHDVSIIEEVHDEDYSKDGIEILGKGVLEDVREYDAAFVPNSNFSKNFLKYVKDIPVIVDLTTPISIEALADFIRDDEKKDQESFFFEDGLIPTAMSLLNGDYFICSTETQKYFFLGMLNLLGRTTPDNVETLIDVIPNTISSEIPKSSDRIMRDKIVPMSKKLILWPGSLYSWFDYELALKSVVELYKERKDFALVFVGAFNPNVPELTSGNVEAARKMAEEYGLLDECVFFLDWLPYEKRAAMYLESDFAVVTYFDSIETKLSYRTRVADCLWGRLPVICTKGDGLSLEIDKHKLGKTVSPGNSDELKKAISELLDDPRILQRFSKNIDKYVNNRQNLDLWINKLDNFCTRPVKSKSKRFNIYHFLELKEEQNRELKDRLNSRQHTVNHLGETNEKLNEEVYRITNEVNDFRTELNNKEKEIEVLVMRLEDKERRYDELEIKYKNDVERLNGEIEKGRDLVKEKHEIMEKQRQVIGRFRGSIVYPFYRLSSSFGKTKIGEILARLLK